MQIVLKDADTENCYKIKLLPNDVKIAKTLINQFLDSVELHANEHGAPTLIFTVLIMMHVMSQDRIKSITPETMQKILDAVYEGSQRQNVQKAKEKFI